MFFNFRKHQKGEPVLSAKNSACAGVLLMALGILVVNFGCNGKPVATRLHYTIKDRQEIRELNKRLVYRLVTNVEPQGQIAIDQMMAVYRDLAAKNEDFDALFVYFYLDEYAPHKGSKTKWGGVTRAPGRQSDVMAELSPFETFPNGTSERMGCAYVEYNAHGSMIRQEKIEQARR